MLTGFATASMRYYTQSFFMTTTHDVTGGSVRWAAYELFLLDHLLGSDCGSSSEEEPPPQHGLAHSFPTFAGQTHLGPAVSPTNSEDEYIPADTSLWWDEGEMDDYDSEKGENEDDSEMGGDEDDNEIGEDEDDFEVSHTKKTDIWAFGMVVYVCNPIQSTVALLTVI